MKFISLLYLGLIALSSIQVRAEKTVTLNIKNNGQYKTAIHRTFDGWIIPNSDIFMGDTTVTIPFVGDALEKISIIVRKDSYPKISTYLLDENTIIEVDGALENCFSLKNITNESIRQPEKTASIMENWYWDYVMGKSDILSLKNDTIASSVRSKLINAIDSLDSIEFTGLNSELRKSMRQRLVVDAYMLWNARNAQIHNRIKDSETLSDWDAVHKEMAKWVDADNVYNCAAIMYPQLAQTLFYDYLTNQYTKDQIRNLDSNLLNKLQWDYYKTNFTGKNREGLLASLILNDSERGLYSTGIDSLYNDFMAQYPHSLLDSRLSEAMAKNYEFNKSADDPEIVFIDPDTANSLTDLVSQFKGSPVLIDLWATWCGPCRKSFGHANRVRDFAALRGLKLVYISIDTEEETKAHAKKLAQFYGLKGYHVIASPSLYKEIFKTFGNENGILGIPHIALYDAEGNLKVGNMKGAEDCDELLESLAEALDK